MHKPSNYSASTRVLASVDVRSQQFGNENITRQAEFAENLTFSG